MSLAMERGGLYAVVVIFVILFGVIMTASYTDPRAR